jgi:hypothetical protein
VRTRLLALAAVSAAGLFAPSVEAAPALKIVELPGRDALPRTPPLAPPQPPLREAPSVRGSVFARERVVVGMAADGTARSVRVVQSLDVRNLGDFLYFIPAPAVSVRAGPDSESQPGLRPNQILWQGFSPRRKRLVAVAELRPGDSVSSLPLRVRIDGAPTGAGPFELAITIENATRAAATGFTADAVEADVAAEHRALRAAARLNLPLEGRGVRIRGASRAVTVDAWVPFAVRGAVAFPAGTVDGLVRPRFARFLGPETVRITVSGNARRASTPRVALSAEPLVRAALPPASARTLDALVSGSLRYARLRQFQAFLANPDPLGRSTTTYVYETAAGRPAVASSSPSDDSSLTTALLLGGLALLAAGAVVIWAHL